MAAHHKARKAGKGENVLSSKLSQRRVPQQRCCVGAGEAGEEIVTLAPPVIENSEQPRMPERVAGLGRYIAIRRLACQAFLASAMYAASRSSLQLYGIGAYVFEPPIRPSAPLLSA